MTLTTPQIVVIEWLYRFPELTISKEGWYSGSWADEDARKNCSRVFLDMFEMPGPSPAERPAFVTDESTPRTTRSTVAALIRKSLLEEAVGPRTGSCYRPSKAGIEAWMAERHKHRGKTFRTFGERIKRPRRVGVTEIRRRGGPEQSRSYLAHHRRREAHHKRIADHLESSLAEWEQHVGAEQEKWRERRRG